MAAGPSPAGSETRNDLRGPARDLLAAAAPGWAGEAEIVRTYFARHRTAERDLLWLEAQAYKETWDLRTLPDELRAEAWRTGTVAVHPCGAEEAAKLAVEMRHFRLIAALAEELSGRPVRFEELPRLAEEERLQELRAPHRRGSLLERTVVNFTEGGGAAMYRVLADLEGGDFERRIARSFREIYADELSHGPAQIHEVSRLARTADDWSLALDIVRKVARQRLRMRNEMFSFPLVAERLEEIAAGTIDPCPLPIVL